MLKFNIQFQVKNLERSATVDLNEMEPHAVLFFPSKKNFYFQDTDKHLSSSYENEGVRLAKNAKDFENLSRILARMSFT